MNMVSRRVVKLFLCLTLGKAVLSAPPPTLKLVNTLYRHGVRSPSRIYPKDIHQVPDAWPDGLGWLSNIGKGQQYKLGQYVKSRYDGFLNTSYYHHDQILVQSSGVERCLMSAYCHLAGLFPPGKEQEWNPSLAWQPVPVQSTPRELDNKLAMYKPCPRYNQLLSQEMLSPAIVTLEKDNKDFFDMVTNETGTKIKTIFDVSNVADTLECEKYQGYTWNEWASKPGVWEKLEKLGNYDFEIDFKKTEMAKLKGGPLLKEIISNMESAVNVAPSPKFYMYSAHATTISALMSAMRVFDIHHSMYEALVMVELHIIDNKPFVKILYRNTTTLPPFELIPLGCESPCRLETFVKVTRNTVPVDWEGECQIPISFASISVSPASWLFTCAGVCLCMIFCMRQLGDCSDSTSPEKERRG